MDIKFRIDKDTNFAFYVDYGAEPLTPLQMWWKYISDYEEALTEKQTGMDISDIIQRQQYAMQKAHLDDLKTKYEYLQEYYEQHSTLPSTVTFDAHLDCGVGMYRTEEGGEVKPVFLTAGSSGSMIVSAPDFTAVLSSSNDSIETVGYHDGNGAESTVNRYGMQLTGSNYGYTTITWTTTGTIFAGMTTNTDYYGEYYKRWLVSLSTNSNVELLNKTGLQLNSHTFQGGTYFTLAEDTVSVETPWDYYNNDILQNISASNAIFPNGYTP